jgi:hypothetical protein
VVAATAVDATLERPIATTMARFQARQLTRRSTRLRSMAFLVVGVSGRLCIRKRAEPRELIDLA